MRVTPLVITREMQLALNEYTAGITRSRRAYAENKPIDTAHLVAPCADCGVTSSIDSRNLCPPCYKRHRRVGTLRQFPRRTL